MSSLSKLFKDLKLWLALVIDYNIPKFKIERIEKQQTTCNFCPGKVNKTNPAAVKIKAADGDVSYIVCDECFKLLNAIDNKARELNVVEDSEV